MGFPKEVHPLLLYEFVVRVVGSCPLERRVARVDDEQYDSRSEDIHLPPVVLLAQYLGSHVALSSQPGFEHPAPIPPPQQAGEAEVSDLKHVGVRQQQILGLYIPVSIALLVHVVDTVHHLMKIGPRHFLRKPTSLSHEIE